VPRSFLSLVLDMCRRPGRAMQEIAAGADYWPPLLFAALFTGALAAARFALIFAPAQLGIIAGLPAAALGPERRQLAVAFLQSGLAVFAVGLLRAAAAALGVFLAASVLYGAAIVMEERREFRFRQLLAVVCCANLALVLGEAALTAWAFLGWDAAAWGPAWFFPAGPARAFLSGFDLFRILGLVLAALGLMAASGFSRLKAGATVAGLWVVAVFLNVAARILLSLA